MELGEEILSPKAIGPVPVAIEIMLVVLVLRFVQLPFANHDTESDGA